MYVTGSDFPQQKSIAINLLDTGDIKAHTCAKTLDVPVSLFAEPYDTFKSALSSVALDENSFKLFNTA